MNASPDRGTEKSESYGLDPLRAEPCMRRAAYAALIADSLISRSVSIVYTVR
jgi:hypothetical protein